jgi:hypothetical protein
MVSMTKTPNENRIRLTESMLKVFLHDILHETISEFAVKTGLSYQLIYNLAHGRIHSLSKRDYRIIFGEDPPFQEPERIDGSFFRGMVRLWLFLNEGITEARIYKEFHQDKAFARVDYRIFSGEVKTVPSRLEKFMERKFVPQGLDRREIRNWILELDRLKDEERVPYEEIKPFLDYIEYTLAVNPSLILNQWVARYESGELKTVPRKTYEAAVSLKEDAERAFRSGSKYEVERLREKIYGTRKELTLYSGIEEELEFIRKHTGRSPKRYLGRSTSAYRKGKLKRIASWRTERINDDCRTIVEQRPSLSLRSLPRSMARSQLLELFAPLKSRIQSQLLQAEPEQFERSILTPLRYAKEEYETLNDGWTSMDEAPRILGISKKAFDLLVAKNSDLFRRMATYNEKWYLPRLYLEEMSEKERFDLMIAKYELLAKDARPRVS